MLKVFRIETQGETDYVCAENYIQALRKYENITEVGLIDFDEKDTIIEVDKKEWKSVLIEIEDSGFTNLAEYMQTAFEADIICSAACHL